MRSKLAHLNNVHLGEHRSSLRPFDVFCGEKMTPDSVRLNPRLSESSKNACACVCVWWGGREMKS